LTEILHDRHRAEDHAALLPPLLAAAHKLAATVVMGAHGRRQAGIGEEFWQFRNAVPGDELRNIDWRRSARFDHHFIRQQEWQAAQSVIFWIDDGRNMAFTGDKGRETKGARARLLGLALMILLIRGGERVGLIDDPDPPRSGQTQIDRIVAQIGANDSAEDYGTPARRDFTRGSRAVFLSDFLGDWSSVEAQIHRAVDRGVGGTLMQILDPMEEDFPFDGRTEFQSMSGAVRFETLRARGLRAAYRDRLAARRDALERLADNSGWRFTTHHTGDAALPALMWLFAAQQDEVL